MRTTIMTGGLAIAVMLSSAAYAAHNNSGAKFNIALDGEQVTFGGDPDGSGTAMVRVTPGTGQLCYTLSAQMIEPATAAHIHEGPAGGNGPVVVEFTPPTSGMSSGCVDVGRDLASDIVKMPSDYYVVVHNAEYPAGALRGQISR